MGKRVCPWWLGYPLASPLRRLMHDPAQILGPSKVSKPGAQLLLVEPAEHVKVSSSRPN
jgi:hypothetical protein